MNVVLVFCRFVGVAFLAAWCGLTSAQELPWHLGSVNGASSAPAAINIATARPGSHEVVVAVVDSGVLPNHPSLSGRVLPGYDMISSPTTKNQGRCDWLKRCYHSSYYNNTECRCVNKQH
jgi:hypothetical protein